MSSMFDPRSEEELRGTAASDVDAEIAGAVDPLESEIAGFNTNEQRALQDLDAMFGQIMPFVGMGLNTAQGQKLTGQAAGGAQAAAQQTGQPMPLGLFGGLSEWGRDAAAGWAQRVFPLIRLRETRDTKNRYEDEINQRKREIASIKKQRGGLINKHFNELFGAEREFALSSRQQDRDWEAHKQGVAIEKQRLAMEKQRLHEELAASRAGRRIEQERLGLQQTELFGEDPHGRKTLAGKQLTAEERRSRREQRLQERELAATNAREDRRLANEEKQLDMDSEKFGWDRDQAAIELRMGRQQARAAEKERAAALIDAVTTPGKGETVESSVKVQVDKPQAGSNPTGVFWECARMLKNGQCAERRWYRLQNVKEHVPGGPSMQNPRQVYNYLVASGVSRGTANSMVKARFPSWDPKKNREQARKRNRKTTKRLTPGRGGRG